MSSTTHVTAYQSSSLTDSNGGALLPLLSCKVIHTTASIVTSHRAQQDWGIGHHLHTHIHTQDGGSHTIGHCYMIMRTSDYITSHYTVSTQVHLPIGSETSPLKHTCISASFIIPLPLKCITHKRFFPPVHKGLTSVSTMPPKSNSCSATCWKVSPKTVATKMEDIARRRSDRKVWTTSILYRAFPTAATEKTQRQLTNAQTITTKQGLKQR